MVSPRYHVIFDIDHCPESAVTDQEALKKFITDIVAAIQMHVLAGPLVAEGIPDNPGLSGFAIIDYSHVSVHTFSKHNEAMVDIFSCKPFDREAARQMCFEHFASPESSVRTNEIWWAS
jgi:S-adenosylmethionine decarboxylase